MCKKTHFCCKSWFLQNWPFWHWLWFQDDLKWMQIAHPCPEGAFAPKRKFKSTNNVKSRFCKTKQCGCSRTIFQHLFYYLQMHLIWLETHLIIYICIRILAAFNYLGLPTHGLGTRLKVDNIEFTLVILVTMERENPRPTGKRRNYVWG